MAHGRGSYINCIFQPNSLNMENSKPNVSDIVATHYGKKKALVKHAPGFGRWLLGDSDGTTALAALPAPGNGADGPHRALWECGRVRTRTRAARRWRSARAGQARLAQRGQGGHRRGRGGHRERGGGGAHRCSGPPDIPQGGGGVGQTTPLTPMSSVRGGAPAPP